MQKTAALVLFFSLLLPGALSAQDNLMKDVFVLDPLVVTGEAEDKTEGLDRSSAVVVEKNRSNNISDFLVKDTEISINRKANFGDSSDIISIRGLDSSRIKLNMDGRDISSTGVVGGNYLDFGTIPLDNIERIEVIKGGSAIEYGNTALGGVINAYSRKPKPKPYLGLYATMGGWSDAYDFHNVRGNYAQKFGPLGAALGISHQKNDAYLWNNDFELLHLNPKLYLDLPWNGELSFSYNYSRADRGLIRSNRADGKPGSDGNPYLPGWDSPINPGYPTANGESFSGSNPSPAMYIAGDGAHWIKQRHLLDLGYRQEVGQSGFFELMAYSSYETRREKNYADNATRLMLKNINGVADKFDIAGTADRALVMDKKLNVDRSYGYTFKSGFEHKDHKIKFGADYMIRRTGGQHVNFVDENYNLRQQGPIWTGAITNSSDGLPNYILGLYAGDQYRINDYFTLDYGLRYDGYDARSRQVDGGERSFKDNAFSPKTMLTWNINDSQAASLALYRNKRVPTAPEYSWFTMAADPMAGGTLLTKVAGTDLAMEDARGVDLAYKYTFDNNGYAKISTWYYDIKDYINMRSGLADSERLIDGKGGNLRTAYNMDARMYGLTLSAMYPLTTNFGLHGGVTWQENKKRNDMFDPDKLMDSLEYVPEWKGNLGFNWQIIEGLDLDADLLYVGKRHYFFSVTNNRYEVGRLGSYVTLGASLSYKLNKHTTVEIYADNITDVDYEERWGYPSMGFNAGVSLKLQL